MVGKIVNKGSRVIFDDKSARVPDKDNRVVLSTYRLIYVEDVGVAEQAQGPEKRSPRKDILMDWHRRTGSIEAIHLWKLAEEIGFVAASTITQFSMKTRVQISWPITMYSIRTPNISKYTIASGGKLEQMAT